MWRKIRDINFDNVVQQIVRATDARNRKACDPIIQSDLAFVKDRADAVENLRNHIVLAALDRSNRVEDLRDDDPVIQALVRCQRHPSAQALPPIQVQRAVAGPDASPRLNEIVAAHPELTWDAAEIQALLIRAIKTAGDVEVDDELPPWKISWEPVGGAAVALLTLVTLRTFGDL